MLSLFITNLESRQNCEPEREKTISGDIQTAGAQTGETEDATWSQKEKKKLIPKDLNGGRDIKQKHTVNEKIQGRKNIC